MTVQDTFNQLMVDLDNSPAHPFVKNGTISFDNEDESSSLDGTILDDIDRELSKYFPSGQWCKPAKITDMMDAEPIARMEKEGSTDDLCRDIPIELNPDDSIQEQLAQLMKVMQLAQAPGTKMVQNYSWRSWLGWLADQKEKHPELDQVDPHKPDKFALGLYLFQMRVVYKYSHNTVVNCFWNQLCVLLKEERQIDLKSEMGPFMKKLFRSLIRKYGNAKFKVCPLLNVDLNKWQKVLLKQDNREPQVKLRALIMFGRHIAWRGDTLSYMKLKHMKFRCLKINSNPVLVVQNTGFKNKGIGGSELMNTVYGSTDLNQCPVYALLWYLFHIRRVFKANTLLDLINNDRFEYKDGAEEEWLFTQSMSDSPMTSKDMSNLMKQSSDSILGCRYTMRSLRSGHICQALMSSIMRYGIIKDSIRQAVKRHVGWSKDESIDAYERMSIFCSQNVGSLQDLEQNGESQNLVRAMLQDDDSPTPREEIRTTMREVRRSSKHPKKSPSSVTKYVSFRRIKNRILELRPKLRKACEEEDRRSTGKKHQTTWMVYHQKYIKKWCENAAECKALLESNEQYHKGSKEVRSSILLNVGKQVFIKCAVGAKRDQYIEAVFYEDYSEKEPQTPERNRQTVAQRFTPTRSVKRKLSFLSDDSSDDKHIPNYKIIELPEQELVTQPDIVRDIANEIESMSDTHSSETEEEPPKKYDMTFLLNFDYDNC